MTDIISQIFSDYGPTGLVIGIIVVCVAWLLAHRSAKPGTSVTILWGLASYTKQDTSDKSSQPVSSKKPKHTAPKTAISNSSNDFTVVQNEYEQGYSLKLLEPNGASESSENAVRLVSLSWIKGVRERLSPKTTTQRNNAVNELLQGTRFEAIGFIIDVSSRFADIKEVRTGFTVSVPLRCSKIEQKFEKLHVGDLVRVQGYLATHSFNPPVASLSGGEYFHIIFDEITSVSRIDQSDLI